MAVLIPSLWILVVSPFTRGVLPTDVMSPMAPCVMSATVIRPGAAATVTAGVFSCIADLWQQQQGSNRDQQT
jgi:hypothetical protein